MARLTWELGVLGKLSSVVAVAVGLVGCAGGAPEAEQQAARDALSRWNEMRPAEYTFVVVPQGVHDGIEARIRVKDEVVLDNVDSSGKPAGYDHFTMTAALQEAIEQAAQEELFKGAYDPEYGYLVWYDVPDPNRAQEAPGRGLDVTCFEKSVAEGTCGAYFH